MKTEMKRLAAMSAQLDALRLRMDVLVIGHRRAQDELTDNSTRHRTGCACGRMQTRFDVCPLCMMERLRGEML